ncbi:MAG TPA: amidohydrolase family protein [Gemmataceae bacterium]|nr:amidohydrolase family protein [Gemmataceae bacterium]
MSRLSRRDFLRQAGLAAALGGGAGSAGAQPAGPGAAQGGPDLALINGVVYTVDDNKPRAQAFAVRHGRFIAVGSNEEVRSRITKATRVIDAAGLTVVPGFIDAHCHPVSAGLSELLHVNCDRRTIAAIKDTLRAPRPRRGVLNGLTRGTKKGGGFRGPTCHPSARAGVATGGPGSVSLHTSGTHGCVTSKG